MYTIKFNREIDSWGYARYLLEYDLSEAPEGETIELQVDSLGGDVGEAITISNMLHERGNVIAHIVGFCASAATWLCYGCDKVIINDDCAFLIHKCSSYIDAWGLMNAEEIEQLMEKLQSEKKSNEAIDLIIANKYAKHSGGKLDIKSALELMSENRWMLPEEALSLGLVDEVATEHILAKSNVAARMHVMNAMTDLPRLPEGFKLPAMPAADTAGSQTHSPQADAPLQSQTSERSFAGTLKQVLTDFFGGAVKRLDNRHVEIVNEPTTSIVMNKDYKTVNQLLQADGLEENEGRIMLTAEQMQAVENRLTEGAGLSTQVDALTVERDEARTQLSDAVAAIDAISADIAAMENLADKITAIRDLIDKTTGGETHAQLEGNGQESAACDPINQIAASYIRK